MANHETSDNNILSVALGGGGPFGIAYESGILIGLESEGIDVRGAESIVGTSAGSWVANFIMTGKTYEDVSQMPQMKVPNWRRGYLQSIGREVFGDEITAPNVFASAVELPSRNNPTPKVAMLQGEIADAVAASSAVPFVFRPVTIEGRQYVDGGARSLLHAARAPRAEHLLVVAALTQHFQPAIGPVRLPTGRALEIMAFREMQTWQRQHGGKASLIRPNRQISSLINGYPDLFSFKIAKQTYELAVEQGQQLAHRPDLAALALRLAQQRPEAS